MTAEPLALADELELTIDDLSRGGAGVGRAPDGQVVLVPFTAPGDRARVRVTRVHKRLVDAELVELREASKLRVEPRCEVFGRCGGCQFQHLPYELQWRTKLAGVAEARERAGVTPEVPVDELPAASQWEYRNRIQLRGEGSRLGYLAEGSQELVPVRACPVARPEVVAALASVRSRGMERAGAYKVEVEVLPKGKVEVHFDQPHAAAGFRQVNDEQNRQLQEWLRARVEAGSPGRAGELWDLYGGGGNLSLPLADRFEKVHCVDPAAPRARPAGVPSQVRFHPVEALAWLRTREGRDEPRRGPRVAFLDPPRKGLERHGAELAALLWRLGVERVGLVSCDPDAHGRDLGALVGAGYEVARLAVLDLFPQTRHVEALAWLTTPAGA